VAEQQERSLIARAQQGDRRAFGELADRHRNAVYGFACRALGNRDDAFDAAQETLLRVWTRLETFDTGRPFRPWLFAIASHVCTDALRRRRAQTVSLNDPEAADPPAEEPGPNQTAEGRDTAARIAAGLRQLTDEQRVALVLKHIQGFKYEEIAEMTGQPVNTVKSHVHRGRRRLAEIMGDPTEEVS